MSGTLACLQCGTQLGTASPNGLCAKCLLAMALEPQDLTASQTDEGATVPMAFAGSERIGRYRVLQRLGEGGCGIVYLAEQHEPVKRRVALKVINPGMD